MSAEPGDRTDVHPEEVGSLQHGGNLGSRQYDQGAKHSTHSSSGSSQSVPASPVSPSYGSSQSVPASQVWPSYGSSQSVSVIPVRPLCGSSQSVSVTPVWPSYRSSQSVPASTVIPHGAGVADENKNSQPLTTRQDQSPTDITADSADNKLSGMPGNHSTDNRREDKVHCRGAEYSYGQSATCSVTNKVQEGGGSQEMPASTETKMGMTRNTTSQNSDDRKTSDVQGSPPASQKDIQNLDHGALNANNQARNIPPSSEGTDAEKRNLLENPGRDEVLSSSEDGPVNVSEEPVRESVTRTETEAMKQGVVNRHDSESQAGQDRIQGLAGQDSNQGLAGQDRIQGLAGQDSNQGQAGQDRIQGLAGRDSNQGPAGQDRIQGLAGRDRNQGQAGRDSNQGLAGLDRNQGLAGLDRNQGLAGQDRNQGLAGRDRNQGLAGQDRNQGLAGRDSSQGLAGRDSSQGLAGQDSSQGLAGQDRNQGLAGQDSSQGLAGQDRNQGLAGQDRNQGLGGLDRNQGLAGLDRNQGLAGQDRNQGLAGQDSNQGLAGQDRNQGLAGQDSSQGLAGRDRNQGLAGQDRNQGLAGQDSNQGLAGRDRNQGLAGRDRNQGQGGQDRNQALAGQDRNQGQAGRDRNQGLAGQDRNQGLAGQDRNQGLGGRDRNQGLAGLDRNQGLAGLDRNQGLAGQDRNKSPDTLTEPESQEMDDRTTDNNTQNPATVSPNTARNHPDADRQLQTENSGSDGRHREKRYPIPEDLAHLLQLNSSLVDKFKSKLMDKRCRIEQADKTLHEGYITVTEGSPEDVSSTLKELFHHEIIEVGEKDPGPEDTLKSFRDKYPKEVGCVFINGNWNICVPSEIKGEIHSELEKLKRAQRFVPLPMYACEYFALKIGRINCDIKQDVDCSANVRIPDKEELEKTDHEEMQFIEVSSERKFIRRAVQWLHDYALMLEVTEKTVNAEEALFFQDVKGQEWIQKVEGEFPCRIDAVVDRYSGLYATTPSGQRLVVCSDTMAATDCDYIVLPLWDGQTEWSSLQQWILRKSFLSEDISSYQKQCRDGPFTLQCNTEFLHGKTLVIVPVPERDTGANKEKEQIIAAYKKAFALCGDGQCSVAVHTRLSPNINLVKSLKLLLKSVFETFQDESSSGKPCQVVIYIDNQLEYKKACDTVLGAIPKPWHLKWRVLRTGSEKGVIKICAGKIQEFEADVIVNSTNKKLFPDHGAVEQAIAAAAGQEMLRACQEQYPQGITENGLAVTDTFCMKNAKKVYHIVLSSDHYTEDSKQDLLHGLRQVILHCLLQASLEKHTTIAFPVLGSGQLKYPSDVVAKVMFSTASNFFREMPSTSLQTVFIVVYPRNLEALQAFKMEEISQKYRLPAEEGNSVDECGMQMNINSHKIQIIHGSVVNKPCLSDVSIERDPASRTSDADTLKDMTSALESVLSHDQLIHKLVSMIFSDKEKIHQFSWAFSKVEKGSMVFSENTLKRNRGSIFMCCEDSGEGAVQKLEEFKMPTRYKQVLDDFRKTSADHGSHTGKAEEADQISIVIPSSFLEYVNQSEILKSGRCQQKVKGKMTTFNVRLEDFVNTAIELTEIIGNKPPREIIGNKPPTQVEEKRSAAPEAQSTEGWSKTLDDLEVEALRFLLRGQFDQMFVWKEPLLTSKGAAASPLIDKVNSLRREDIPLTDEEISKLGDTVETETIEAFVKTVPSERKAAVFAFDYDAVTRAKHLVTIKAGRVKVTARGRRKFEAGNPGQQDQTQARARDFPEHAAASNVQVETYKTLSGIAVLVYKTDITKLPVDAIVNAANENLSHGGGVASAISRAAGFALDDEGREHIRKHGQLRVTEVVETLAGNLPCQKVLHAVGPRWEKYTDKAQCRQHLVDTVFNCLRKADGLGFTSVALPSISSAIFGVPLDVCAESYLSAVKTFDSLHGQTTSLKHIHFVDVSDVMISIIQRTFSAQWGVPAGISPGGQGAPLTAGGRSRQEGSADPLQTRADDSHQKPPSAPYTSDTERVGGQVHSPSTVAQSQDEPVGFPCVNEVGAGTEPQVQVTFKDLDLTVIFQRQSLVDTGTESVILWQDVQNAFRDKTWKQFQKTLSPQVQCKINELKKEMSTAERTVVHQTMNKQFVFVVLSSSVIYSEDRIRFFVEQAINRVDLKEKRTVAISRRQKGDKSGKATNKDKEDTKDFIGGLFKGVKNYAKRSFRSISEIHVVETDPDILQFMVDHVKTLIGVDRSLLDQGTPLPSTGTSDTSPALSSDACIICTNEPPADPKRLPCGHVFCKSCIDRWFHSKPTCPSCGAAYGIVYGDQPEDGTMKIEYNHYRICEGYQTGTGTYYVDYSFPPGTQTDKHPNPGKRYSSTRRRAYLPNTREGRKVLMLLQVAFHRCLVFTVGSSVTSGQEGIVWNDIHHKTQTSGGPASFGYPDPNYFVRVLEELANKDVTEKDLSDSQRDFIENPAVFFNKYGYRGFAQYLALSETRL